MFGLHIGRPITPSHDDASPVKRGAELAGRHASRARLFVLTIAASIVAAIAIAAGSPATGLAVYLAATLPFVFFS